VLSFSDVYLKPALLALLAILAFACGSTQGTSGSTTPLSIPELKYRVIAQAGTPFVCGPPVVAQDLDNEQAALEFPAIKADTATYSAILAHAKPAGSESSIAYKVAVWKEWRNLQAIQFSINGSDLYGFQFNTATALVKGTVSKSGTVTVASRTPARMQCPICLAAATLIDTPAGPVRVTDLKLGESVWTVAADGTRVAGTVTALGSVAFPLGHDAVRLQLSDGRAVTASAGHPTTDGRTLGALLPGDSYDGAIVTAATRVRLTDGATYDLLPSGPTGEYWADGVLLLSTLWDH
jgi:hypothetical protein